MVIKMIIENNDLYFTFRIVMLTIFTLGMMCSITEFKYSVKKTVYILSLYILYVLASTGIIVFFFGYLNFLRVSLLIVSVPGILLVYNLAKDRPAKAVFNYMTQILFSMYCCLTVLLINTYLWNSIFADIFFLSVTYTLIILFEYRFIRRPFLRIAAIVDRGWGLLALIPCSLSALTVAIAFYPVHLARNPFGMVLFYLLIAVTVIIYFTTFRNLSIQYHLQLADRNIELLELQVNNLKERLSENEAAAESVRIERHDARHRFQTIAALMENGDIPAALSYIHTSLSQLQEPEQTRYCSNPFLNAVLSSYLGQAIKQHIRIETHLSIPDRLPVEVTELSIVFANALENAIQACCHLPETDRRIILKCIHKPSFMLEISNPYSGTILFSRDKLPLAAENDHGIGTRSIAAFCRKHDALYSFSAENGWFTMKIVL